MIIYRFIIVILLLCHSIFAAPVEDKQQQPPRFLHTRPALDDFRIKQFFDTRTAISLDSDNGCGASVVSLNQDDEILDDSPSSLEDISEGWDDAFNMDSPYPPFNLKKVPEAAKKRSEDVLVLFAILILRRLVKLTVLRKCHH